MVDIEYRNAYTEVLEILKTISEEDYIKIPKEKIQTFKENCNKEHIFKYDPKKTLEEQNVAKAMKYIIAILFRDYWATPMQREKILAKEKYDLNLLEEQKREQYNPDNIFKNRKVETANEPVIENNDIAVVKEKSLLERIIDKIKEVLKIK